MNLVVAVWTLLAAYLGVRIGYSTAGIGGALLGAMVIGFGGLLVGRVIVATLSLGRAVATAISIRDWVLALAVAALLITIVATWGVRLP